MARQDDGAARTGDDPGDDGAGEDGLRGDDDVPAESPAAAGSRVNTGVQAPSNAAASARSGDDARETDLELVRRCQKGDSKAFEDLLGRYRRKVYGLAMGMVSNRDDAMDVMQDAFVRVFRHIHSFQGDSSFYTWLYRITMNLCIDHVRKSARTRAAPFEDRLAHDNVDQGDFPILPVRHDVNPGKAARRHEVMKRIEAALETLSREHREVIVMREFEGLSYEEMARVQQVPKGTIMSRLFHARHKLQKVLADLVDGDISVV